MRRALLAAIALLTVAGCGDRSASADGTRSPVSSSPTAAPGRPLSAADDAACRSLIENDGDVYRLLNDLVTSGSASGAYKAQLDMGTLASSTGMFDGQVQDAELAAALHSIVADAPAVAAAIQAHQPVRPEPLRTDLTDAARICQQHGVTISWFSG